jgi:carbon-monoxide dehydrogenase large subunit
MRYVGQPVPRREDADLLTGRARTVADLREPDTVELAFCRSLIAHGLLRHVDVQPAQALAGIVGAWSAEELRDLPVTPVPPGNRQMAAGLDWPALARDRVRYAGEAIAVVAAARRSVAEDGAEAVRIELDPLPPLVAASVAADSAAPLFEGHSNVATDNEFGAGEEEIERAMAGAAVVVEGRYREQPLIHTSMEPRAVLVRPERDGGLTIWVSHQAQHRMRDGIAQAFALGPDQVRVIVPSTGGAFGSKSHVYPEYIVAAHLARLLGRPVRWVEDRAEALLASVRGRSQEQRVRIAADAEGRFLAYELTIDAAIGGYPHTGAAVPIITGGMSTGAYVTPFVRAHVRTVLTTTAPTSAYRGAGRPEAAYAIERTVDRVARRLAMDPAELRRRNFITDFPYTTPTGRTYDSGNYPAALDKALAAIGYDDIRAEQRRRRSEGANPLGIGLATYVERSGGQPGSDEFGGVEVRRDGTFIARVGSTSTGQGHLTVFAQVVADALCVEMERVEVLEGDTDEIPYGFGSFGSRSLQVGGEALWRAAHGLIEVARQRAATALGVDRGDVAYDNGWFRSGGRACSWKDLAPIRAEGRVALPQAFPFGAYAAVVEIDPPLGTVGVLKLVAVDDYGNVVNPLIVEGQGYGSVVQGLGQALYEEAVLDDDGIPAARTLLDYLIPTIAEVPPIDLEETHTPNPNVALGTKGAGEAGCIGTPPAVVNAVCDALAIDHIDMPLTPETVWRAAGSPP